MRPLSQQARVQWESLITVNANFAHDLAQLNQHLDNYIALRSSEKQGQLSPTLLGKSKKAKVELDRSSGLQFVAAVANLSTYASLGATNILQQILTLSTLDDLNKMNIPELKKLSSRVDSLLENTHQVILSQLQRYNNQIDTRQGDVLQFKGVPILYNRENAATIGERIYQIEAGLVKAAKDQPMLTEATSLSFTALADQLTRAMEGPEGTPEVTPPSPGFGSSKS